MITHFVELELHTVSITGVKQVYADRLGLPILADTGDSTAFELTPHTRLRFVERYEPISPAHIAFQVSRAAFDESVALLKSASVPISGDLVDWGNGMSVYFRDGDGNILELIAHDYVQEGVLPASQALKILYMREVGFPVAHVASTRAWMMANLEMGKMAVSEQDDFCFVVGGTAHAVVVDQRRPWMNIAMKALPPPMLVIFGTPDRDFLARVGERLSGRDQLVAAGSDEIVFKQDGYTLGLRYTPQVTADLAKRLNLPVLW